MEGLQETIERAATGSSRKVWMPMKVSFRLQLLRVMSAILVLSLQHSEVLLCPPYNVCSNRRTKNTAAVMARSIVDQIKLSGFSVNDIGRCHRMGHNKEADKPRPILIKLREHTVRERIWYAKSALKGTGVTVSEFLTRPQA
ncbi:hypothetical protein ACJJTC_018517 [Scirpophaga incertulas]